ncbi:hypothetical protein, partial [Frankia sp. CcWB2]
MASPVHAADDGVELGVTVDGQPLGEDNVVLGASAVARVVVSVQNLTRSNVPVDSVRLSGTMLGLTFFDYDTRVRTTIPARGSANWTVDLDMRDLDGRATGLMPVELAIRGADLHTVAEVSGTADIHGSLLSIYGLFGLGLVVLMGLLWAVALLPLGRHAVPATWWQRGLRFVPAGCGVGLFVIFALSATRLLSPGTPSDFGITITTTAVCFGLGALLPQLD